MPIPELPGDRDPRDERDAQDRRKIYSSDPRPTRAERTAAYYRAARERDCQQAEPRHTGQGPVKRGPRPPNYNHADEQRARAEGDTWDYQNAHRSRQASYLPTEAWLSLGRDHGEEIVIQCNPDAILDAIFNGNADWQQMRLVIRLDAEVPGDIRLHFCGRDKVWEIDRAEVRRQKDNRGQVAPCTKFSNLKNSTPNDKQPGGDRGR